jgi:hypothetical protein
LDKNKYAIEEEPWEKHPRGGDTITPPDVVARIVTRNIFYVLCGVYIPSAWDFEGVLEGADAYERVGSVTLLMDGVQQWRWDLGFFLYFVQNHLMKEKYRGDCSEQEEQWRLERLAERWVTPEHWATMAERKVLKIDDSVESVTIVEIRDIEETRKRNGFTVVEALEEEQAAKMWAGICAQASRWEPRSE